jgi:L-malate glycosyltransferase
LRVLYLLDSDARGGAETLVLDVCRAAQRTGLDVTLVSMGGERLYHDIQETGVPHIRLQRMHAIDWRCIRQLRRLSRDLSIDLMHTHQAVETLHAYAATRGTKTKVIQTLHGYTYDSKNRIAMQLLIPRVDALIAVSKTFRQTARDIYGIKNEERIVALYNGVDLSKWNTKGEASFRERIGIGRGERVAGMIANFWPWKDQITICKSLSAVLSRHSDLRFVFVGGRDPLHPTLLADCVDYCYKVGLSDRVLFVGQQNDIPSILRELDLFVMSSRDDTFGIAVVEAMISGVPCVISDIASFAEISGGGRWARLFRAGDPDSLASVLTHALDNWSEMESMARGASEYARREFSIEAHIEKLKKLYASICAA